MKVFIITCFALSGLFGIAGSIATLGRIEAADFGPYPSKGDGFFPATEKQRFWMWGRNNMPVSVMVVDTQKTIWGFGSTPDPKTGRDARIELGIQNLSMPLAPSLDTVTRRVAIFGVWRRKLSQTENGPYLFYGEGRPLFEASWRR